MLKSSKPGEGRESHLGVWHMILGIAAIEGGEVEASSSVVLAMCF